MKKRIAIYCRVDKGGELQMAYHAVQLQKEYLTDFASKHGYSIFKIYSDIGYAGHDLTRPEFVEMLHDAKRGAFDAILVVNENRLYRGEIANIGELPIPVITPYLPNIRAKQQTVR